MFDIYHNGLEAWQTRVAATHALVRPSDRMKALLELKEQAVSELRGMDNMGPFSAPYAVMDMMRNDFIGLVKIEIEKLWNEIDKKME